MTTERAIYSGRPAGFWIRSCANVLDLSLIVVLVVGAARLGSYLGWYIPIEITVLGALVVYGLGSETWARQSIGKWFCGLTVIGKNGARPRLGRLVLRGTLSKVLPVLALGAACLCGALDRRLAGAALLVWLALAAGFVSCGFNRRKRAWHDWIAGTVVIRNPPPLGQWSLRFAAVGIGLLLAWAFDVPSWISIARDYRALRAPKTEEFAFEQRNPKDVVEVASLDQAREHSYGEWLRTNAVSPVEYAVGEAKLHPVLVFGEGHGVKENLELLNELIPQLHKRADVTTVAMEICLAEDNGELQRLVTGRTFDRTLAMKLARHTSWPGWGLKEYWDVFETVWQVNQTIPAEQKKMRVIGLGAPMDLPSLAMSIGEEQATLRKYRPFWERLRVMRVIPVIPKGVANDVQMAAQIEREIFDKSEHAIIWIGQEHAHACPQIGFNGNRHNRMGAFLRQMHGADIFFIWLHGSNDSVPGVIEAMMKESGLGASGFNLSASPLGLLRDKSAWDYQFEPRLALADMADGYVYLKPEDRLTLCTWMPDFITPAMFTANKPYFQAYGNRAGHPLNGAADANAFFQDTKNLQY